MKKVRKISIAIAFLMSLQCLNPTRGNAQIIDIIKEAIKGAIVAIDLKVQWLQNRTLDLQIAQKEIDNAFSKLRLDEITDWTGKQKQIYQDYFDELYKVKAILTYYKRITDIINAQKQLVNEYKTAYALFQQDSHFNKDETDYMFKVYSGIIDDSVKSLDQILKLLADFAVQMTDGERLDLLNKSATRINQNISDLRKFNNQNVQLSVQRAKDQHDLDNVKKLYGLQ